MERVLVDFSYAQQLGHAVEALQYCVGHAAAGPGRHVSLALDAATPVELAGWCPAVTAVYPADQPFLEPCPDADRALAAIPRDWDRVVDDTRRHQPFRLELFPGVRDHCAASDRHLRARVGRSVVGAARAGYLPHQQVRLELPADARAAAARRLGPGDGPRLALLPAGSSEPALHPAPVVRVLVQLRAVPVGAARHRALAELQPVRPGGRRRRRRRGPADAEHDEGAGARGPRPVRQRRRRADPR